MALREPLRSSIHQRFVELLGREEAGALMDQFPPWDYPDLVTKEYLDLRIANSEQTIRTELAEFRVDVEQRFTRQDERIDARFDEQDRRLAERFEKIDQRFDKIDQRFEKIDQRFDKIDDRFEQQRRRFDKIDDRFEQQRRRFEDMHEEHGLRIGGLEQSMARIEEQVTHLPSVVIKELLYWLVPVMLTAIGVSVGLARLVG